MLSAERQKEIKQNLSKYAKEYKKDEDDVINIHIREDRERKLQLSKEFAMRMAAWKRQYDEERPRRRELRGTPEQASERASERHLHETHRNRYAYRWLRE